MGYFSLKCFILLDRLVGESLLVGHEMFSGLLDGGMEAWMTSGMQVAVRIDSWIRKGPVR